MPTVEIGATITLRTREVPPALLRAIRDHLTFVPRRAAYGSRRGAKPDPVLFYSEDRRRGRIVLPRGSLSEVRSLFEKHGVAMEFRVSEVVSRSSGERTLGSLSIRLRDYQSEAVRALIGGVQGIAVMPCGAGKTTTATAALLASGEAGIVVAHTRDILDQWIETIERVGGSRPSEVSTENGSPLAPGEIRVAMVQSLTRMGRLADPVLASAGALVLDECHHVPAATWMEILARCPARFRWGLTATPERSDGLGFALGHLLGPIRFRISTRELIDRGFLLAPRIVPVCSDWSPSEQHYPWFVRCSRCSKSTRIEDRSVFLATGGRCSRCRSSLSPTAPIDPGRLLYSRAVNDLSVDPRRVAIVARIARLAERLGRTVLILLARKDACSVVRSALSDLGVEAEVATGDLSKRDRRESLDQIRAGRSRIIIATQLADEGLDLPSVDCVINASPGRSGGRAKQRVGRALRRAGLDPLIFEIVDLGEFEGQWESRCTAYATEYGASAVESRTPLSFERARAILLSAHTSDSPKPRCGLRF